MTARRRRLTRTVVVAAALKIVDRDGVQALTMRGLGRELDADPMAAYYHLGDKDALLSAVVEAVWDELELPESAGDDWKAQLTDVATAMRDTLRRHPNALPLLATKQNRGQSGLRLVEHVLTVLTTAGFPMEVAAPFVNASASFLIGHALAETATSTPDDLSAAADTDWDLRPYPLAMSVLKHSGESPVDTDKTFHLGLRLLIEGLDALDER